MYQKSCAGPKVFFILEKLEIIPYNIFVKNEAFLFAILFYLQFWTVSESFQALVIPAKKLLKCQ